MSLPVSPTPDWLFWDRESSHHKPIATFIPEVLGVVEIHTSTEIELHVRLILRFKEGQSEVFTIPVSAIETEEWFAHDQRCLINPKIGKAKAAQFIANNIRLGMENAPKEEIQRLDRLGVHHVDENVVFFAGDRVITRSPSAEIPSGYELAKLPFHLDVDPELAPADAFRGMLELIRLSPEIGRVLVAHAISGFTRAAFKSAGMNPCTVLVIVGKTGMLKSHYVPHMVQLYNRSDGVDKATRFNSTNRFIEDTLFDYSECTAVIDDLHTAESQALKRINETTAEEIIRRIGDDSGRGRKEGNASVQKQFRGNVVFIGEYIFGKESTVPRALVAELTKPINGAVLDKYQRDKPLLVSTFYYHFIAWYVGNFQAICDGIRARLTKFRGATVNSGIHGRLRDTQFYLCTSFMIFLEFCRDSEFINNQDAKSNYASFRDQLDYLVLEQQARINPNQETPKQINYLKLIRNLYKDDKFHLAASAAQFREDKSAGRNTYDGLIHYECLCLRSEKLEKRIQKHCNGVKMKALIAELLSKGALKLVGDKNTVQISNTGGARFYAICLDKLN